MDDQSNRPHRKTKEKKPKTKGGTYPTWDGAGQAVRVLTAKLQRRISKLLLSPTLGDSRSRLYGRVMYVAKTPENCCLY